MEERKKCDMARTKTTTRKWSWEKDGRSKSVMFCHPVAKLSTT